MRFNINKISQELAGDMQKTGVWQKDTSISIDKLRVLELSHYDFSYNIQIGQMVVLDKVAANVINIFKELFAIKFPIAKIKLMNEYNGDDELSMADNNTSCFNWRNIAGSQLLSMHSYGLAIDINPVQNPYIITDEITKEQKIFPENGNIYLNRNDQRPGMVEPIVSIFKKHQFDSWGGDWKQPLDYHHFQVSRDKGLSLNKCGLVKEYV